jgi:penicillin-binding protein 1A
LSESAPKRKKKKPRVLWKRVLLLIVLLGIIVAGGLAAGFVAAALKDLPALSSIEPKPSQSSIVYAIDGSVISTLHGEENRIPVKFAEMPLVMRQAAIAIEDHQFYDHMGINIRGLARAVWARVTRQPVTGGGSTITQQLAKNAFLTLDSTMKRKIQDMVLAIELERRYTKNEILEMYLNQISFGNGAYGVEAATQLYFGKHSPELTLPEAALLAGITNGPAIYDPYKHLDAAKARQKLVLQEMVDMKYITEDEFKKAVATTLVIKPKATPSEERAGHFTDFVINYLLPKYGAEKVYNSGLKVYTTLDMRMQKAAEDAVKAVLDKPFPVKTNASYPEAAVIIMDPQTGHIKAMVGGRSHTKRLELNRAIQAKRQPGSAFKPIAVYGAALDSGFGPGTLIDDVPISYATLKKGVDWAPENYDRVFHGLIILREAVEQSYNVPAVKVLDKLGAQKGVDFAIKLGITSLVTQTRDGKNDVNLSIALGGLTDGVTPMEMATAYSVYAAKGVRVDPLTILKVVDTDGNILEENKTKKQAVISEMTAYLMTNLLEGVVQRGTGTRAAIGRPVAGKTGTTSDYRDAWFAGYTPDLVGIVWMGFDKDQTMEKWKVTGGTYPAQIWQKMMAEAHKGITVKRFTAPTRGLVSVNICTKSGKLPGPYCPSETVKSEIFLSGLAPTETCDVHVPVVVCADDPLHLATPYCPHKITKSFIKRPVPYVPEDDKKKALDTDKEVPTTSCTIHGPGTR